MEWKTPAVRVLGTSRWYWRFTMLVLIGVGLVFVNHSAAAAKASGQGKQDGKTDKADGQQKAPPRLRIVPAKNLLPAQEAGKTAAESTQPSGPRWQLPVAEGTLDGPFLLYLADGTQLQGAPEAFDGATLTWRSPHFADLLNLPAARCELRRVAEAKPAVAQDTVKFLNGQGWLKGKLVSLDATQAVFRPYDGPAINLPRESIEWLYLGQTIAADCADLTIGASALRGRDGGNLANWKVRDGILATSEIELAGFPLGTSPEKWRVIAEVVHNPQTTSFILALNTPSPGSMSNASGSMLVRLEGTMLILSTHDGTSYQSKSASINKGPDFEWPNGDRNGEVLTKVEVIFDERAGEVAINANGEAALRWKAKKQSPAKAGKRWFSVTPQPIFRVENGKSKATKPWIGLRSFVVEPGAGRKEPAAVEVAGLEWGDGTWHSGEIAAIDSKSITFSDAKQNSVPRTKARMIRLAKSAAMVAEAPPVMLTYSDGGLLSAKALRLADGAVTLENEKLGKLTVPLDRLGSVNCGVPISANSVAGTRMRFASGEVLPGSFSGANATTACEWRTGSGDKPVAVPWGKLRAVIVKEAAPIVTDKAPMTILFRNGDFLNVDGMALQDSAVEAALRSCKITWPLAEVEGIFPGGAAVVEGGSHAAEWRKGVTELTPKFTINEDDPQAALTRSRLQTLFPWSQATATADYDGVFLPKDANRRIFASRVIRRPPRTFELRFRLQQPAGYSYVRFVMFGKAEGDILSLSLQDSYATCQEVKRGAKGIAFSRYQTSRAKQVVRTTGGTADFRLFVDLASGTVTPSVNGNSFASLRAGCLTQILDSQMLGLGMTVTTQSAVKGPVMLHDLFLLPWNGRVGAGEENKDLVLLANGDIGPGSIASVNASGVILRSEDLGDLEIPFSRIAALQKAATERPAPDKIAKAGEFRIRLNGGALTVRTFRWEAEKVIATLPDNREISLPAAEITEIVRLKP